MPDGRPFEEYEYDEYDGDVDGDDVDGDGGVDQHLLLPLLCHHHQVLSIWLHLPRANWQFVIDNFFDWRNPLYFHLCSNHTIGSFSRAG